MARLSGKTDKNNNIKEDLRGFLLYFVKVKSDDEEIFSEELKQCQLKFCVKVHPQKEDQWIIHTKLKQIIETSNQPGSAESNDKDFFYIRSQVISYKSGGNLQFSSVFMSVETVVTREHSKFETVFKTSIPQNFTGKEFSERSFVREKLKRQSSLNDSVFSPSPINDTRNFEFIPPEIMTIKPEPKKEQNLIKKMSLSFKKSNKALKKITKKRSTDKISNSSPPTEPGPSNGSRKKSVYELMRLFSIDDREKDDEKPTNIYATVSLKEKTHVLDIIKDDIEFIDEDQDEVDNMSPVTLNPAISVTSLRHNFSFQILAEISDSSENIFKQNGNCECNPRRYKIMEMILRSIANKTHSQEKKRLNDSLKTCDKITGHFSDCIYNDTDSPNIIFTAEINDPPPDSDPSEDGSISQSRRKRTISIDSKILFEILDDIKIDTEIAITYDHINYFKEATTYEQYEIGLKQVLPDEISLKTLILFFILTRTIIMQIDDPNYENNNIDIRRIKIFSINYLLNTFYYEIAKEHNSLVDYFMNYESVE